METPNVENTRSIRKHTPRLSERKKSLFTGSSSEDAESDVLRGIVPLDDAPEEICAQFLGSQKQTNVGFLQGVKLKLRRQAHIFKSTTAEDILKTSTITRGSLRLRQKSDSLISKSASPETLSTKLPQTDNGKENIPTENESEIVGPEEHLQMLFSTSMRLDGQQDSAASTHNAPTSDIPEQQLKVDESQKQYDAQKRSHHHNIATDASSPCSTESPQRKLRKIEKTPAPQTTLPIPTTSFYSTSKIKSQLSPTTTSAPSSVATSITPRSRRYGYRPVSSNINKGVRHMIRRRPRAPKSAMGRRQTPTVDVEDILKNVRNVKLRNRLLEKRVERDQIEKVHSILRNSEDPIKMARPLSSLNNTRNDTNNNNNVNDDKLAPIYARSPGPLDIEADFSDIESNSDKNSDFCTEPIESGNEEIIPIQQFHHSPARSDERCATPLSNRKFFKSGRNTSTRKEVTITDNIKATVFNGRISLVEHKVRTYRKIRIKSSVGYEFSDEQARVDEILKNLDDTDVAVIPQSTVCVPRTLELSNKTLVNESPTEIFSNFSEFRKRLPYNTSDPELIKQQHLLLDFLITNDICTEKNFTIFIANPDAHKEEAARIVDQAVVVVDEQSEFRGRLPYKTCDPKLISQQHRFLDFLIAQNICTEENFNIFIVDYDRRQTEATQIMEMYSNSLKNHSQTVTAFVENMELSEEYSKPPQNSDSFNSSMNYNDPTSGKNEIQNTDNEPETLFPIFYPGRCQPLMQKSSRRLVRNWNRGQGTDQYQIDAGQRSFGAQQCKQCGLVYSIHEPEEEKLHRDYHASLHLLRFKSWIDEDVVAFFHEWGVDGRILRVTDASNIKRKERLMDVLKVVDKELGFSNYSTPKIFVAYLAVRKYQFVGLCLVQPLQRAHKYICMNEVDCCTSETFEAKCGISRIWVSPLHRRLRIASKLIQAVQLNTIIGEEIPIEQIAFSAPTEIGKRFAQKTTGTEHFLVYQ